MSHADHMKTGVVYGLQPVGTFESTEPEPPIGYVYCFGRSTRARVKTAVLAEEKIDAIRGSHSGLNRCKHLVYWERSQDVDGTWEGVKQRLRIVPRAGGVRPKWVRQLCELGDNWFCSDLGPVVFAEWLAGEAEYVRPSEVELQQIATELDAIRMEAAGELRADGGLRVQAAGDELVIGPVSSQFAARAVLGLLKSRAERTCMRLPKLN